MSILYQFFFFSFGNLISQKFEWISVTRHSVWMAQLP